MQITWPMCDFFFFTFLSMIRYPKLDVNGCTSSLDMLTSLYSITSYVSSTSKPLWSTPLILPSTSSKTLCSRTWASDSQLLLGHCYCSSNQSVNSEEWTQSLPHNIDPVRQLWEHCLKKTKNISPRRYIFKKNR